MFLQEGPVCLGPWGFRAGKVWPCVALWVGASGRVHYLFGFKDWGAEHLFSGCQALGFIPGTSRKKPSSHVLSLEPSLLAYQRPEAQPQELLPQAGHTGPCTRSPRCGRSA